MWASYAFLTLTVLAVCNYIIIANVRGNQHLFGSERKLTVTLFIVTDVSLTTLLPWCICIIIPPDIWSKVSLVTYVRVTNAAIALYFASSLVNPLIYAIRMQEFRKALRELFLQKDSEKCACHGTVRIQYRLFATVNSRLRQ